MGLDRRVPDGLGVARDWALDGVTRSVSGREPPRSADLQRASGSRFDSARRKRTANRSVSTSEWTDPRLLPLWRPQRSVVRLLLRGLQAVDQGLGQCSDDIGCPDGSRPICRHQATPSALSFSPDPHLRPSHQILSRAWALVQPVDRGPVLPWRFNWEEWAWVGLPRLWTRNPLAFSRRTPDR